MKIPNRVNFLWMAAGAAILLVIVLVVLRFQRNTPPSSPSALSVKKIALVEHMRLSLTAASEAEKSAILARTDKDAESFADQARTFNTEIERMREELAGLMHSPATSREDDALSQFTLAFSKLQLIDKDLLDLVVKNTNVKAYGLTYGPAADELRDMNAALSSLVTSSADAPESKQITYLAFSAQIAALRIQTILPQHIAEENDPKMDAMEAIIASHDKEVRKNLADLAAIARIHDNQDLQKAVEHYEAYNKMRTEVIAFSRENTNVRALSISLNQKRKMEEICQALLNTLLQAIMEDSPPPGRVVRPR